MLEVVIDPHQIRIGARLSISFQRTLRVPEDDRTYPLPPGLGLFPLLQLTSYRDRVPAQWFTAIPAALMPIYQREALWLGFKAAAWKPNAVKLAIGGINVLTGEPDSDQLCDNPQNYIVCPPQPWIDGIQTGQGTIRQFVAMPLGQGYTVEAAIAGTETGGLQIVVFEPKPGRFPDFPPLQSPTQSAPLRSAARSAAMGLGAGGQIRQKIYPDPYGLDTWDATNYGRTVVYLINSLQFEAITGQSPPASPIDVKTYTESGFPWFELYDEAWATLTPDSRLTQVKSIAEQAVEQGEDMADQSLDVPEWQIQIIRSTQND